MQNLCKIQGAISSTNCMGSRTERLAFRKFFFFNSKIISESCGKQPENNRKNTPLELYRISKHKESTANSAGLCNCSPLVCLISFLPGQQSKCLMVHTGVAGGSVCVTENWMREDLSDLVLNESNTWKIKFFSKFLSKCCKAF